MTVCRNSAALCVTLATLLLAGCGDVIDPSRNQTEEFSGTLTPGGPPIEHRFSSAKNGEFEVRVTRLSNADAFLGLVFGPELGGVCTEQQRNFFAQINRVGLGGLINSGRNCVVVFDAIGIAQPLTYTIAVSHP